MGQFGYVEYAISNSFSYCILLLYFCYFLKCYLCCNGNVCVVVVQFGFIKKKKKKNLSFIYQNCHHIKKPSWYPALGGVFLQLVTQSKHLARC